MNDKFESLNKKIRFMLDERQLPENIKKEIEKVYQEYRNFYEEYIKTDIHAKGELGATRNIEAYFEEKFAKSISSIDKKYKYRCDEIGEIATTVLPAEEVEILEEYLGNDKNNYSYTRYIVDTVIDSITDSRNQMFRVLESLNTESKRINYIYEQIKLIENTSKLKLGNLKTELDIDNKQILKQIMDEYEQYKENSGEKDQRKEFVEGLQKNVNVDEKEAIKVTEAKKEIEEEKNNNPLLGFQLE